MQCVSPWGPGHDDGGCAPWSLTSWAPAPPLCWPPPPPRPPSAASRWTWPVSLSSRPAVPGHCWSGYWPCSSGWSGCCSPSLDWRTHWDSHKWIIPSNVTWEVTWQPWWGQDTCEQGHRHSPLAGDSSLASQLQAQESLGKLSGTGGHSDGLLGRFAQIPRIMVSFQNVGWYMLYHLWVESVMICPIEIISRWTRYRLFVTL